MVQVHVGPLQVIDRPRNGPSPIDSIAVEEEDGHNVVVDGNRRTSALKLLHNPDLAQNGPLAKRFRQIAAAAHDLPTSLNAVVFPSREDVREWQMLRHGGEARGAGVVNWNAEGGKADGEENEGDALAVHVGDRMVGLLERSG